MAFDIKKVLDDLNPSDKAMKWIIVGLFAIITVVFGWGINKGKSTQDIETLQKNYAALVIKVDNLQQNTPRAIEAEISNEIKDVKIIVFKEIDDLEAELTDKITLVVESQGEVTKEWLLKAIDIRTRTNANIRVLSSMDEVSKLSISAFNIEEPAIIKDSVVTPSEDILIDSTEPVLVESPEPILIDSTEPVLAESPEPILAESPIIIDSVEMDAVLSSFKPKKDTTKKTFFLFKLFKKDK